MFLWAQTDGRAHEDEGTEDDLDTLATRDFSGDERLLPTFFPSMVAGEGDDHADNIKILM